MNAPTAHPAPQTIDIRHTLLGGAKLTLLGLGMTVLFGLIAFRIFADVKPGSFSEFIGWCGMIFSGVCTIGWAWRMATMRGPVVTLTPTGIRDIRLAAEAIPWSAIQSLHIWQVQRQKILVLAVDPAVEARLTLTRIARWTRNANARLGADGLCIATQGLAIDTDMLAQLCAAHVAAAGSHVGETAA